MKYRMLLVVVFIGLGLYAYGYIANQNMFKWAGFALVGIMFVSFMAKKLAKRKS